MFKNLGKRPNGADFNEQLEYLSQIDEYEETDFDQMEVKKYQPNEKTSNTKNDEIFEEVEKFKNRKIYEKLDAKILNEIKDDHLIQTIFDTLSNKVESNFENEYEIVKSFNKHKQMIYSIWVFTTEVDNGGFLQFYENSSGKFFKMVQNSLKLINAYKHYEVLKKANNYFGSLIYSLLKIWHKINSSFDFPKLNKLDNEYYKISKQENLDKLQIAYIRKNIQHFIN